MVKVICIALEPFLYARPRPRPPSAGHHRPPLSAPSQRLTGLENLPKTDTTPNHSTRACALLHASLYGASLAGPMQPPTIFGCMQTGSRGVRKLQRTVTEPVIDIFDVVECARLLHNHDSRLRAAASQRLLERLVEPTAWFCCLLLECRGVAWRRAKVLLEAFAQILLGQGRVCHPVAAVAQCLPALAQSLISATWDKDLLPSLLTRNLLATIVWWRAGQRALVAQGRAANQSPALSRLCATGHLTASCEEKGRAHGVDNSGPRCRGGAPHRECGCVRPHMIGLNQVCQARARARSGQARASLT